MDSTLAQLQQRVKEHFDALTRTRETSTFPIFALEHGLNEKDLKRIQAMLLSCALNERPLSSRYWLLWVIYATELGYGYEGDEYWNSFEDQTPGWEYHNRAQMKFWFRLFQKAFDGVTPSGPWAEHFSIIAWPITHAILPRYLQRQFAKLLYDLRFRLASRTTLDARTTGRLLAIHASHAPKRFRVFLEQEELTGQIAFALLGGKPAEGRLIHPPTLKRIVADLEKVRSAREWLKETQRVVSDRFKGIGRGTGPATPHPSDGRRGPLDTSHLAIRPSLSLRHADAGKWSVFLEVKSFRPVAALSAEIRSFLDRTRCRLNGAHDFKPTGWLLSGDRKGALRSWPDPALPLIRFERSNPTMDHLLESECRLHPGPIWLFRIGTDGIARHIASRIVRPSFDYIVVTTALLPDTLEGVTPCNLACESVSGYRLSMPSPVSAEMTVRLKEMGLHVARTIRVWPAGLPGRGWDGEGSSEWLTTESPCFGIDHDHPVEFLSFRLNDEIETLIRTEGNEGPLFVRLPCLPAGTHKLTVKAKRSPELESVAPTPAAEGFVQLTVREPEPWTPGITSHSGMIVRADPDNADLDTFWRNKVSLSVDGPEGFAATFDATLQSADGSEILSERVGTPMDLPITRDAWRNRFDHFLKNETRAWRYLEAAICVLTIRADTLGTCTLRFEHEPLPVRWVIRSRRRNVVVRLVDDSGQDETDPEIRLFSMERPFESAPLTLDAARSGCGVEPPGGLFVVTHGRYRDAVLVSAASAQQGLQGLGVESSFPELSKSAHALSDYFRRLGLWRAARLSGFLASLRHGQVMNRAVDALRTVLCGENWAREERRFSAHPGSQASLKALAALVDKHTDFGNIILRGRSETNGTAHQTSAWFVDAAARNYICQDRDLSKFALRLANDEPLAVAEVSGDLNLERLLANLTNNPAILRAARLLTLLRNSPSGDAADATQPSRSSK